MVRRRRRSQRPRQRASVRRRLQFGRRGPGVDRRRRRHHADARRVRQRGHQERIGRVSRCLVVPSNRSPSRIDQRHRRPARAGCQLGQPAGLHQRLRRTDRRPDQDRPGVVLGDIRHAERAAGCLERLQEDQRMRTGAGEPVELCLLEGRRLPDAEQAGRASPRVQVQRPPRRGKPVHGRQLLRSACGEHPKRRRPPSDVRDDEQDGVHGQERQHVRSWPSFLEHGHLGSELEVRRSAHVQRPLAGRRVLRPSLLVQLDCSADAGASTVAADAGVDHRHLGTVVVRLDDHARHEQHGGRHQQLLPARQVGRRSLVQGWLQVRPLRRSVRPDLQRTRAGGVQQRAAAADLQHALHRACHPRLHHAGLLRSALSLPAGYVYAKAGDGHRRPQMGPPGRLRGCRQHRGARLSGPADHRRHTLQPVSGARCPGGPRRSGLEHPGSARRPHLRSHRERHERHQGLVRDLLRSAFRRTAVQVAQSSGLGASRPGMDRSQRRSNGAAERDQPEPDPIGDRIRPGESRRCS